MDNLKAPEVILHGILDRSGFALAYADSENTIGPVGPHLLRKRNGTPVVESSSIDKRFVFRKPEHTWPLIARLRLVSDGACLDETESQSRERLQGDTIFIKSRCQTHWIAEAQTEAPELSEWLSHGPRRKQAFYESGGDRK